MDEKYANQEEEQIIQLDIRENLQDEPLNAEYEQKNFEQQKKYYKSKDTQVYNKLKAFDNAAYASVSVESVNTTKLHDEYGEEYRDKTLFKSRESKIKNQKSRLYKKARNVEALKNALNVRKEERNVEVHLRRSLHDEVKKHLSPEELEDLSVAYNILHRDVQNMHERENGIRQMAVGYAGLNPAYVKLPEGEKEAGRSKIMTDIASALLNTNLTGENMMDDSVLVQNAQKYEDTVRLLDVFKRMQKANPAYMETLRDEQKSRLNEQITRLGDITAFYKVRKLIIENPYYQTHYNEELSLNAKENDPPEKKLLSKLLRASFYLGKNLQGISMATNEQGEVLPATAKQKIGKNSKAKVHLARPTDAYMEKEADKIARISADESDYDNLINLEIQQTTYREKRDALIEELTRENRYLPPESMKIDLTNIHKKPITKEKIIESVSSANQGMNRYFTYKHMTPKERKMLRKLNHLSLNADGDIGIQSKRYGEIIGGDDVHRCSRLFVGAVTEELTEEEIVELFENITKPINNKYRGKKDDLTENMLDETFMHAYGKYMDLCYRLLMRGLAGIGDKMSILGPEDCIRAMTPEIANVLGSFVAALGNSTQDFGLQKFLKLNEKKYPYMKDFFNVYAAISSSGNYASVLGAHFIQTYALDEDAQAYEQQRREEISQQIEELENTFFKPGVTAAQKKKYYDLGEGEENIAENLSEEERDRMLTEIEDLQALNGLKPGSIYFVERGKTEDITKPIYASDVHEGQLGPIDEVNMAKAYVIASRGSCEAGYRYLREKSPKLARQFLATEQEKQQYLDKARSRHVWNPKDEDVQRPAADGGYNTLTQTEQNAQNAIRESAQREVQYQRELKRDKSHHAQRVDSIRDFKSKVANITISDTTSQEEIAKYGKDFKETLTAEARTAEANTEGSELFKKKANNTAIRNTESTSAQTREDYFIAAGGAEAELSDMDKKRVIGFLTGDEEQDRALIEMFANKNKETGEICLIECMKRYMDVNVEGIDLSSDEAVVASAQRMENLCSMHVSMKHMIVKYSPLFDALPRSVQDEFHKKGKNLNAIVTYYRIRKMLIKDGVYNTHLDKELGINPDFTNLIEVQRTNKLLQMKVICESEMDMCLSQEQKNKKTDPEFDQADTQGFDLEAYRTKLASSAGKPEFCKNNVIQGTAERRFGQRLIGLKNSQDPKEKKYWKTLSGDKRFFINGVKTSETLIREPFILANLKAVENLSEEDFNKILDNLTSDNFEKNMEGLKSLRDFMLEQVNYLKEKYGNSMAYPDAQDLSAHSSEFLRDHQAMTNMGELMKYCMQVPELSDGCENELTDALAYVNYIGTVNVGHGQVVGMPTYAMGKNMGNMMLTVSCTNYQGVLTLTNADDILSGLEKEENIRTDIHWNVDQNNIQNEA